MTENKRFPRCVVLKMVAMILWWGMCHLQLLPVVLPGGSSSLVGAFVMPAVVSVRLQSTKATSLANNRHSVRRMNSSNNNDNKNNDNNNDSNNQAKASNEWDERYTQLHQFYRLYGHNNVENVYRQDKDNTYLLILSRWVEKQRLEAYNHPQYLTYEQTIKLQAVGIVVSTPACLSLSRQPKTIRHNNNNKNNHAHVYPPLYVSDPDSTNTRKIYASPWEQRWEDMHDRLVQFVATHGFANCNNQRGHAVDKRLAHWVQIQRENLRLGMVRRDRQEKLQAIGVTPLYHKS